MGALCGPQPAEASPSLQGLKLWSWEPGSAARFARLAACSYTPQLQQTPDLGGGGEYILYTVCGPHLPALLPALASTAHLGTGVSAP